MRFVAIKSDDQLDSQSLHRVRERWVMRRTAAANQIRGLLFERGSGCASEAQKSEPQGDGESILQAMARKL